MSNHAALIRESNPGKTVTKRGKNFIEFSLGEDSYRYHATGDRLHYGAAFDKEIDTTWVSTTGAWQYQIIENDFSLFARNILNAGNVIQWLDKASNESVTLQPLALNWVDNVTNSRQQITQPQAVSATVTDSVLYFQDGYGTGRHFKYTANPDRLVKEVIIDAITDLPTPTVANPYLEIELIISTTSGIDIYVDGAAWDGSTQTTTANEMLFKVISSGRTAWKFVRPGALDSQYNFVPGIFQLRKQGANRYCTVRIPKTWIDTAVFPIKLDPTFDSGTTGAAADTNINENVPTYSFGELDVLAVEGSSGQRKNTLLKFDLSSISGASVVNSYSLYLTTNQFSGGDVTANVYRIISPNTSFANTGFGTAASAGDTTWNYRIETTNRWAGDTGSNGGTDAGCSVSGTDYSSTLMGTGTLSGTYTTKNTLTSSDSSAKAEVLSMISTNYGMVVITSDAQYAYLCASEHATGTYRPELVIDYSTNIAGTTVWGQATGTSETNVRTFATNWTGTGTISGSGNAEKVTFMTSQYEESEIVNTSTNTISLRYNQYASGDSFTVKYKTAATVAGIAGASWTTYSTPFTSLGYTQIRIEY